MKLFFETGIQMRFFLVTLPLGFLVCFLLDVGASSPVLRLIADLMVLFLCGVCLVWFLLLFDDTAVRGYHLLGVLAGAILYMSGAMRCRKKIVSIFEKRKAGKRDDCDEKNNDSKMEG